MEEENILVFSDYEKVYALDKDNLIEVTSRKNPIKVLCSHNEKLYDMDQSKIYETLTGK
ncbi:hypothetical protein KAT80_02245 [Candidatus Pacearchaeota archaeon]|nr:hypothetical protein [Candidatus Pacearchaeota archaeon]